MKKLLFIFLELFLNNVLLSQSLSRQALIDFTVQYDTKATYPISIKDVPVNSRFYSAGLRKNDQLISINSIRIKSDPIYQQTILRFKGEEKIILVLKRADKNLVISCQPSARPFEEIANCTTLYDQTKLKDGFDVRMIVTKPKEITKKIPVIFFVQWLSCDQIELDRSNMDGWAYLIEELASKTGYAMIRTEKPGVGDSNGPDCSACDLMTEINAYKASFQKMLTYDFIDKDNIIVIGGSIGGALAPVVAEGQKIKGLISTGGFSTSWYEHILDFERTRLFYSGASHEKIDVLVKKFYSFYYEYLIQKRKPSEIIKSSPTYKSLWYQSNDLQFGRPVKYYQQLQDLNMSYYWYKINCPVLVVYGEYDWIMSRAEQENIVQLLNAKMPESCKLKIIPGMNHHFSKYASRQEAFNEPFIKYEPSAFEEMRKWMKSVIH